MAKLNLYGGRDPRYIPMYTLPEAAHYTGVLEATLRTWVVGRYYPTEAGKKFSRPIIALPDEQYLLLSFINLVECHVLSAIRREHKIPFPKVRNALDFINEHYPMPHPLAHQEFQTDGIDLFIEQFEQFINVSGGGQLAMRHMLEAHLKRIEHDHEGVASRLYPFTRRPDQGGPKFIVIDPRISFGRAVLVGTGIPTAIIAERYKGGDSIEDLAYDYDRKPIEIHEAIRSEIPLRAA